MITTIRSQFKQSTYRYIAFGVVFVFALSMVSSSLLIKNAKVGDSWAIKVNGKKISYQDFSREIAEQSELLAHIRAQYGQYADLLMQAMNLPTDPKSLAFEKLVKEELIRQAAQEMDIQLSPEFIASSVNNMQYAQQYLRSVLPTFVFDQSGALNSEKLTMFLKHKGLSVEAFERKIEQALANAQVMNFIATSSYVPQFDLTQEAIATRLGKKFSYLTFSFDTFLAGEKKQVVTDEDLLTFYNKENLQRRRYSVPEKRNGIIWKFDAKNYGAPISDEQISEYYEDNKASKYVADPVKIQVKYINEKQLENYPDMTLEMVKVDIEQNPSSLWAKKWELMQPFARGEKKGALETEAFLLQNEGDISSVIDTKDGKMIVQLVKRLPRTYKSLTAVRNEIKTALMEKQFKKNFVKDLKAVQTSNDPRAIEAFIAEKAGKKELAMGIAKNDTRLSQQLFDLNKGEYGFFVENETGVAVLLTDIAEKNLPELDSIKDVVQNDIREERAKNKMAAAVEQAKEVARNQSFETISKQFNATLAHTDMVLPGDHKKLLELDKKGLPSRAMLSLDTVGSLFVHTDERSSALIKLDAIEEYDQNKLLIAQNEAKDHLAAMRMKLQVESFVASLHRNATIETNETILIAGEEYSE